MKVSKRVQAILLMCWTLLPCASIWFGLNVFKSAVWTYVLYHGLSLPAICIGWKLWKPTLQKPTLKEIAILIVASILFSLAALGFYDLLGKHLFSGQKAVEVLTRVGWCNQLFWPISIYVVLVNPVIEELFWRGVILNALDRLTAPSKWLGITWSSIAYGALHYSIVTLVVGPVIGFACVFFLSLHGALLAVIYRRTQSIIMVTLVHGMLNDVAAVLLMQRLFAQSRLPG